MRRTSFRRSVAALLVLATVAAACGDDDDDDAATTSSPAGNTTAAPRSTEGGAATTAGGPTTTAKPASGEPVKIGYITAESSSTNTANGRFAALAAAEYINEELGGLHGRPIEVETCAVLQTPESSVSCSNELVDQKPVVIFSQTDGARAAGIPVVVASGIPYYTTSGGGNVETTTNGVFNFAPGTLAMWASLAKFSDEQNWDRVGIITLNLQAVSDAYNKYGKPAFDALGLKVNYVPVDAAAADLTPQLQTAAQGAKVVLVVGSPTTCVAAATARQALGLDVPLMLHPICWNQSVRDALGAGAKGTYLVADESTPLEDDPEVKLFQDKMKQYAPNTPADGVAATGFQGMVNLHRVLQQIPAGSEITAATATAAFRATKGLPLFMKYGAKATCDGKQISGLISVCNASYWVGEYDGKKVSVLSEIDVPAAMAELGI